MPAIASQREPGAVGPYRLLQRLGEGGMGVVYLGLDPEGHAVAVKVLRAHVAADPDARRRLEREVETLRRVRHPRVAEVIDADVAGDLPYLVTRFVPGKPLDVHVREHGPLSRGHVARVGTVLADALRAIHALGIVHRDVKPANVMMLDGEPVLIDFGIAHVADEARITLTGLVMGTPGYLSPEIVGGQPVTAATDWWGWGATLAYAASGRSPFGTGPLEVVLDRVRRGDADLSGMDAGLRTTLGAALTVDPRRRPAPAELVSGLAATVPQRAESNGSGGAANAHAPAARVPARSAAPTEVVLAPNAAPTEVVVPPHAAPADAVPAAPRIERSTERVRTPATSRLDPPPPARPQAAPPAGARSAVSGPPASPPPSAGGIAARPPAGPPARPPVVADPASRSVLEPVPERQRPDAARGVLLGVLLALSAVAIVAPYGAFVWAVLLATIARTVERCSSALLLRRNQFGRRGSDGFVTAMAMPWRAVLALGASLLGMLLPLLVGISVVFIGATAQAGTDAQNVAPSSPGPLAVGMAALLLAAWWGPGGGSLRRGSRIMARSLSRERRGRIAVWSFLVLVILSALLTASNGASPHWGPLEGSDLLQQLQGSTETLP